MVEEQERPGLRAGLHLRHGGEPLRDQHADLGARHLEQGVRADRGAVQEGVYVSKLHPVAAEPREGVEHAGGRVRLYRRDLVDAELARPRIEGDEIGEAAADVDANAPVTQRSPPSGGPDESPARR